MKNFNKALIVITTVGLVFTAQAKDLTKADWMQKQEDAAQKKGKQAKPARLEKRWEKIDLNKNDILSNEEKKAAKKNKKNK